MIRADQVSEEWDDRPFGPMSRSGMARLYGRSTFSFLRILHSDSHGGCTRLQSLQPCVKIPLSLCPHKHLLSVIFFILTISC